VLAVLREYKDTPGLRQKRITTDYAKEVVEEFLKEVKFYVELDSNPQSYLTHISRYHPERAKAAKSGGPLIIPP
jgi:hypothetical protein